MKLNITVTMPKSAIPIKRLQAAIDDALDAGAANATALLSRPMDAPMTIERSQYARVAGTSDKIYTYVSKGTKAHRITAKRGKMLAFGPSTPSTRVGSLDRSGGSRGAATTFRKTVRHPGTKARNFDETAAKELAQTWPAQVERLLEEAANA